MVELRDFIAIFLVAKWLDGSNVAIKLFDFSDEVCIYTCCAFNDDLPSLDLHFYDQEVNEIPGLEIVDWTRINNTRERVTPPTPP
jgi:hypothetical protein